MKLMPPVTQDMDEAEHQKQCVKYAAQIGLGPFLICIPNGTWLPGNAATRAKYMNHLKAMGLRPGASDLFLAKPVYASSVSNITRNGRIYHGAFFEMKRPKPRGAVSQEQLEFGADVAGQGYYFDICWGFDDFVLSLQNYLEGGLPLRVTRG